MTTLYVVASIVALTAGYLAVGWQLGKVSARIAAEDKAAAIKARWGAPEDEWLSRIMGSEAARAIPRAAKGAFLFCLWAWPLVLVSQLVHLVVGIFDARIDRAIDRINPVAQQRRIREQEARIKELERELGIGGTP